METKIPVTIEKSHLVTIGEKLYGEKASFIRELVNNAYDADATEVHVEMNSVRIAIRDNGSGMDEQGLRQYFTIGSDFKKNESVSPRFQRRRIGEFGIGKFAALAVCRQFVIETQKGAFHARLVFDKQAWSQKEDWHLDFEILPIDLARGNGTTITLLNLSTEFFSGKIRRYLAERTPIHVNNFAVFINGDRITDDLMPGQRMPVNIQTSLGQINGQIIIVPPDRRLSQLGIAVCVRGVLIRYEPFGLDTSRKIGAARVTGKIHADFLPVTSSRDDFLRDSIEFQMCSELMRKEITKTLQLIHQEGDRRANLQASRVLKEAMTKIGKAMRNHRGLFPSTPVPLGETASLTDMTGESGFQISEAKLIPTGTEINPELLQMMEKQRAEKSYRRPMILGSKSVIRKLRVADAEIAVRMEHLGADVESLVSGGIIFVNIDHPLYRTYQNNDELLTLHIARVLTKELALRAGITSAEQAFSLQSELLSDAFRIKGTPPAPRKRGIN